MNKDDSTDGYDFAFLRRMANAERVEPRDIDQLVEEIGGVLHSCRVDESNISDEERKKNEELMRCVLHVDQAIQNSSDDDAGALYMLFRKRISTPTNLESLLRMMDADIRTGEVRCVASSLILVLGTMTSIYGLKMNDGSYFASKLISCCSKSLEDDTKQDRQIPHNPGCLCSNISFRMLLTALQTVKEDPLKVLDRVTAVDWKTILETHPSAKLYDVSFQLFYLLRNAAVTVLVLDRSNSEAKSFFRKLGSCRELFRSSLRRLVALRSLSSSPGNMSSTLKDLNSLSLFHECFYQGLVPPPSDPEIEVLMSLANHSLKEARSTIVAAIQLDNDPDKCVTTERYDSMIEYTEAGWWTRFKHLSDDDRWRMLETAVLSKVQAGDVKKARKTQRQDAKQKMKSNAEAQLGNDEVCTNCFRLESSLGEGKKLMICGWCKQVSYCSRDCQIQHWKKFHKKECIGGKGKSKKK
jgi:hypothetical protein